MRYYLTYIGDVIRSVTEVRCPHCTKAFIMEDAEEILEEDTGYRCPHCKHLSYYPPTESW